MFISSSFFRHMRPSHWILCPLMKLTTDVISISSRNSLLYFLFQVSFSLSYIGPTYYPPHSVFKSPEFSFSNASVSPYLAPICNRRSCYCRVQPCFIFFWRIFWILKTYLEQKCYFSYYITLWYIIKYYSL